MFEGSDLINLRNTMKDDVDFIYNLESNTENSRFIIPWSKVKHLNSLNDDNILHLIIENKNNNKPVGYIILAGLRNPNQSMELMRITISSKGKGYGNEALKIIKDWTFNKFKANRLWLDVKVNNARALHIYKKQGFTVEGTLRECLKSNNGYESLHIMSILKREYID
ncbi:GNAT family N-acetyltransferase [Bacillus cereus]|uniref:GNAT family N-acetyltransferase n=1 Tax=Bacillus thuringiensis TaxID=1428 RepID=UPI000BF5820C|nr:GNAT family protein [Bacillus thuringiensis]MED2917580.1 GNAT family protein [Bacillus thuringiensis]MED2924322.1 GNAT family protein [Bacillus thuringiensis]MED3048841.1 GNAT family protein [Bacillus thuringiensis]PFB81528.1 GNAT family N-acetyltransferase [Bacillus thuringiensis]PFJ65727.1 GNAT family N-acetyltransferase [Bacillus thuringiensis]